MQTERAYHYARCSAVLNADHEVPGCEAAFDQALSNGLTAIVAHEWPGNEANAKGWVYSAAELLQAIAKRAAVQPDGTHLISWSDPRGDSQEIRVDTDTLHSGITAAQAPRHARGPGTLERRHVDALLALDGHPALGRISEVVSDERWGQAEVRDIYDRQRAEEYLEFIGDEEALVRAERAPELVELYHPKHNPDWERTELEECRVCEFASFRLDFPSEFPNTGRGACLVCSYTRSAEVSYYLTLSAEIAHTFPTD